MLVSAEEGYRLWAESYDSVPNPLLALEERVLSDLPALQGKRFLDAATGTGRWLKRGLGEGADGYGVDCSEAMLDTARRDRRLCGRLVLGDLRRLPFGSRSFEVAVCSFALGYLASPGLALQELARVTSGRVVISDLHPAANAAGWTRSFRTDGEIYQIEHHPHRPSDLEEVMTGAGFAREWVREASFGERERSIFESAGKGASFAVVAGIPALCAMSWVRKCD